MKYALAMSVVLLFSTSVFAGLSPCILSCYEAKKECSQSHMYTFNSCDEEEFACKASCSSGNRCGSYQKGTLPLKVAFNPLVKK